MWHAQTPQGAPSAPPPQHATPYCHYQGHMNSYGSPAQPQTSYNPYTASYQQAAHHQQQPGYSQHGNNQQPNLWGWFAAVDTDRSGSISALEMQRALSNGFSQFNIETVQLLMNMFDGNQSGQIGFEAFQKVFEFINQWAKIFQGYDTDRSGAISFTELKTALSNFGYRLSDRFYNLVMFRFCDKRSNEINFDNFIRICVLLNNITKNFQMVDTNRSGVVQLSYEQFVEIFFNVL